MAVYHQTTAVFSSSPTPPTKPVETPVVVSYAYILLLAARKALHYIGVATPKVPLNNIAVLYQDLT